MANDVDEAQQADDVDAHLKRETVAGIAAAAALVAPGAAQARTVPPVEKTPKPASVEAKAQKPKPKAKAAAKAKPAKKAASDSYKVPSE